MIWHGLQIVKAYFRNTIWFMISENGIKVLTRFFNVVVYAPMNQKSYQTRQTKICVRLFPIILALKNYLHVYL